MAVMNEYQICFHSYNSLLPVEFIVLPKHESVLISLMKFKDFHYINKSE